MSVDMFTCLNNDILQCILYEWLDIQDICQLDIAVCNHSIRQLYYEALQLSTSSFFCNDQLEITEVQLYEIIQWSKKREIKNPIQIIGLYMSNRFLSSEKIYELANDFKSLNFTTSLNIYYWNPLLFYAFASLKNLTSFTLKGFKIDLNEIALLGSILKQLPLLEKIFIRECPFEPIFLRFLSEIPSLKQLEIDEFRNSTNFISNLSLLTQLESLTLKYNRPEELLDLSCLSTFHHLTELILISCTTMIDYILPLTQLKTLELEFVELEANNINYENYLPLNQLESFIINNNFVDQNFIQFILQSKQLKEFYYQSSSELQASIFYEIEHLFNLSELTLNHVAIDSQLFDNICKLSQLKELDLIGYYSKQTHKQNICLSFSKLSKQLTSLYFINQPYITNKNTFEEISQLENLQDLSLDWDLNNLEELQPLSQLKQLSSLTITGNSISSLLEKKFKIKIKEMLQLPKLRVIFLDYQLLSL